MGAQESSMAPCFPCVGMTDTTASWQPTSWGVDPTIDGRVVKVPPQIKVATVAKLGEMTAKYIEKHRGMTLTPGSRRHSRYEAIVIKCRELVAEHPEPIRDVRKWHEGLASLTALGQPPDSVVEALGLQKGAPDSATPAKAAAAAAATAALAPPRSPDARQPDPPAPPTPGWITDIKPVDEPVTMVETPTAVNEPEETVEEPETQVELEPRRVSEPVSEPEARDVPRALEYAGPPLERMPAIVLPAPGAKERLDKRDHKAAAKAILQSVKAKICPSEHDVLAVLYDIDHVKTVSIRRNAVKALYFATGSFQQMSNPLAATGGIRIILNVRV